MSSPVNRITISRRVVEYVRVTPDELGELLGLGTTAIRLSLADGALLEAVEAYQDDAAEDGEDGLFEGARVGSPEYEVAETP